MWHQCPDQTWTQGAVVNTRDYVTGAGQLNLELDAVNAAGVDSRVAETLNVDNDPVGVRSARRMTPTPHSGSVIP